VHALTMRAGDYSGKVGLLATRTRTATVRAVSEARVISLEGAQFQALVDASESNAAQLVPLVDHWTRRPYYQHKGAKRRKRVTGMSHNRH
jgi:CRP-like cAMP-binding protein